jgi:serine protease Do/serine protease DegQ
MPGTKVRLGVSRGGKALTFEVLLTKLDEKPDELIPGVDVTPLTDETRLRFRIPARFDGLMVRAVDKDSPYADVLVPDVLIVQIDRDDVTDLPTAKAKLTPGRHLLYVYYRGALRVVRIDIKEG